MSQNLIALAVPFFFLFIGLELLVARARKRQVYRLGDALGDLGCGMGQQVALVFAGASLIGVYAWIFDHHRLHTFPAGSVLPWLAAFVAVDFIYYWWHRLSHKVNVLWAAHVVHHQSEDYNLAVALRQAAATSLTELPFYLPMALLGIPTPVYAAMVSISTLYQFWIHTELIGKLGPVEWFLNTPSHHRVHHAINPRYLDKNYGATLIVWDRLFGTYEEEIEAPVYGITKPLATYDPIWAQIHYWFDMWKLSRQATDWRDKVFVWFASPAWKPRNLDNPAPKNVSPDTYHKYDPKASRARIAFVATGFVLITIATFSVMMWNQVFPRWVLYAVVGAIVAALWIFGRTLEGKRAARAA